MGEYEDRYPDAYGRGDEPAAQSAQEPSPAPIEARDRFALRGRFGLAPNGAPASDQWPTAWQHAPSETPPAGQPLRMIEPTPIAEGSCRGLGPRGYVRSPQRIYEDLCDRLTDDPYLDASDIEVLISGVEVSLAGSVDNADAAARAQSIAAGVPGVKAIRNALSVRPRSSAAR